MSVLGEFVQRYCAWRRAPRGLRKLTQLGVLVGTLLVPEMTRAGIVTLDFPDAIGPSGTTSQHNAVADGFRISPSAEYTLVSSGGGSIIDHGIGWDSDGPANGLYLGTPQPDTASLYVDAAGAHFSLLSAIFTAQGFDEAFTVTSSRGGIFDVPLGLVGSDPESFAGGPKWTDITWLTFSYDDPGAPTAGLERLVLAVDEPGTLALFMLSLVIVGGLRRASARGR